MKEVTVTNELLKVDANNVINRKDYFWIETTAPGGIKRQSHSRSGDLNYFCVGLLYYGSVAQDLEGCRIGTQAPALLLLEKDEVPTYSLSADRLLVSLCFSKELLETQPMPWNSYLDQSFMHCIIPLAGPAIKDYHKYFSLIVQATQQNDAKATEEIINLLLIIFKMIAEVKLDTDHLEHPPISRLTYYRFKALIEQDFKKQHQVQEYADRLCMTTEMLGKMVRETVNRTPKQLIDERLITEAKRMLLWSKKTNKEIAYELGFESDSYFNRYFKKHCHQTPLSFRLQSRSAWYTGAYRVSRS
jgi:AraC-like DNA-binding protein